MKSAGNDIRFSVPSLDSEEADAVFRVLNSGWLTSGDEVVKLEEELADYLGANAHVVAVSSCTAALEILLSFLDLPKGSRVALPTWTFASTALVPIRLGLTPVLLDVESSTLNISVEALQSELERGDISAVIPVHFGGVPVDPQIHELCARAGIPIIEDAAHALGASDSRGKIGTSSNIGCAFSFYATKNLTSAEGGAIATNDEDVAKFARSFRQHGLSQDAWKRYSPSGPFTYDLDHLGIKANLPDVLAAIARAQLQKFPNMQVKRRKIVTTYRSLLDAAGIEEIPNEAVEGSADHLMVIRLPEGCERSYAQQFLRDEGIGSSFHFRPLHTFDVLADKTEIGKTGLANANDSAMRAMSLPLHPDLLLTDVENVVDALKRSIGI